MEAGSYIFYSTRTYTLTTMAAVSSDVVNVRKNERKKRNEKEREKT